MSGLICAIVPIIVWGITFVSTKYLLISFTALEILVFRFFVAYVSLWIIKPKLLKVNSIKTELLFVAAGVSGVTVYQYLENLALSYTAASNVSIIVGVSPMLTAIISQIYLKEKSITTGFVAGFIVAITGIILVSFNGAVVLHLNPKGDMLAFGAALCWGFYSLFITKINKLSINAVVATRRMFFWALVSMVPVCIIDKKNVSLDINVNIERLCSIYNIGNIVFLGFVASALCFVIWGIACKKLGTIKTSLGIYVIPVVTIVFANIFLKESISVMGVIGAILTISGLFISRLSSKH